jgi:hypothetical protein
MRSPNKPWIPGNHPDYAALRLRVNLCQDRQGNVWSDHNFETAADAVVARTLPQGGVPQIAHALLTEAVRREAFVCALVEMTKDPKFLARYKSSTPEEKASIEANLQKAATFVITKALEKMVGPSVADVLAMMSDQ